MAIRFGAMFDGREIGKRIRRSMEGNYSYRKILVLLLTCGAILLYFGPTFAQWLFSSHPETAEVFEDHCIKERLSAFHSDSLEYNVNILQTASEESEPQYLPYIGNGVFGLPITQDGVVRIKRGRALLLAVPWQPFITYSFPQEDFSREAIVTHFVNGVVHKFRCLRDGYQVESQYYAHRTHDGIFIQDIKLTNSISLSRDVSLLPQTSIHWSNSHTDLLKVPVDGFLQDHSVISGFLSLQDTNKVVAVSIVHKNPPRIVQIKPRSTIKLEFLTSIQYSEPITMDEYVAEQETVKKRAIEVLKRALSVQSQALRDEHVSIWQSYWHTGLRISDSKASGAINGHKINSTMYYVLSQVPRGTPGIEKNVGMNEGCYRGHHTLDAPRLWKGVSTISDVNDLVEAWLVTLEKQGCHHLITGGPTAVQQAIVLSLGGLRFSNQHLEFNIDPQYLHRDYLFRRISYGNVTHLNISVTVGEDNRAILGVALDKSDSVYYGCDAGCLDAPVPLSQSYTNFPVKLTKPLTAILYITSDHQHMQDLRNALHVHAVDDAPAHDHLVMALHKHGHQLGGLPTLFWVSICFLIVIFHLFLCKLVVNEYYGYQDRQKVRYSKL